MDVPSLLTTKNAVDVAFHAARCAFDGTRYERLTRPGLVLPSVTRTIVEPNVGSLNVNPAAPSCGTAGFGYVVRFVIALYAVGAPLVVVVKDQIGPAVAPVAVQLKDAEMLTPVAPGAGDAALGTDGGGGGSGVASVIDPPATLKPPASNTNVM